jgi:hypothetical protein
MNQRHWNRGIGVGLRRGRLAAPLLLVAVLCVALLAAAAPALSADPPYLAVTSTTPAANALDVERGANITVEFDYDVNGATVTEDTFNVDGSRSGPVGGTYSGGGTGNITFVPSSDFEYGEIVTVTLTTGIEGMDGRTLEAPVTWQFVVGVISGVFGDSGQSLGTSGSIHVSLGDLDGDRDLDAFVANWMQPNRVWLNDGSGVFTDSGQSLGSSRSIHVSLGDVDGDGDLDAFVANGGQGNRVWLNAGNGTFTGGQSLGSQWSYGVSLGDVDGDGDLDAFVANAGANRVWSNDGSGVFTDSGQSLGSSSSHGISLGDLDGDGDLDAFVANYGEQADKVWSNAGSGTFTDSGQSLGTSDSAGVALGDVDGDGDLDAFVANGEEGNTVWLNDGSGGFTDSGQSLGASDSTGVSLGDVDGDGDLDAFVANYAEGNMVWLNDGSGGFTDSGQSLGHANSEGVSLGDLDGDGDLDAFVVNYGQGNRVWLNLTPPGYDQGYEDGLATCSETVAALNAQIEALKDAYLDTDSPTGAVHAHDNFLWARNRKPAEVTLSGYVGDELSIARDGGGTGVSSAYLLIDGTDMVLLTPAPDGSFEVTCDFTCAKGAVYTVELYATDTTPMEDGGPNTGLVDQTYVHVR